MNEADRGLPPPRGSGERSGPTNPFHPPGCSRLLAGRCLGGSRRAGEVGVFGMIGIERPSVVRHAHALSDRRTADTNRAGTTRLGSFRAANWGLTVSVSCWPAALRIEQPRIGPETL